MPLTNSIAARVRRTLAASQYVRDITWILSGNALAQFIGIASMPILTRIYEPEHFAIANIFLQIVSCLAILQSWRIEYFILLCKDKDEAKKVLEFVSCLGITIGTILTIYISFYANEIAHYFGNQNLKSWLILAPLNAWLLCMAVALQQYIQHSLDFKNSGLSETVGKTSYVISGLIGATGIQAFGGLIISAIIGAGCKCIWLWNYSHIKLKWRSKPVLKELQDAIKPYRKLALSTTFASGLSLISGMAPLIFIGKSYGQENLGQLSLVISTLYLPSGLIGGAIGQVFYQRASQLYSQGKPFYNIWRDTAIKLIKIGIPLYICIGILSPLAYPMIFGAKWQQAGEFGLIMAISSGISFVTSPLDRISMIVRAWKYQIIWNLLRVSCVFFVIYCAILFKWSIIQFLIAHVIQMSIVYLVDWLAGMRFANSTKGTH